MNLRAVWRPVIVDDRLVVLADGVHDERVTLIMADGFAIPGRRRILRMGHVKIYVPHLRITRIDDHDLLGGLEEIDRPYPKRDEAGHARRPAARARRIAYLSGQHFVVVLLQPPFTQGFRFGLVTSPIRYVGCLPTLLGT